MNSTPPTALLPRKPFRPSSSAPRVLVSAFAEDEPDEVVKLSTRASVETLRRTLRSSTSSSNVVALSMAYAEMLQQTRELHYPNTMRTAFASTVLDFILVSSPSVAIWKPLVDDVRKDLFASIYSQENPSIFVDGDATDPRGHRFSSFPTYFSITAKITKELETVRRDLAIRNTVGRKEMMITERIIKRWQLMLLDRLFCAWRQFTKQNRKKEQCIEKCMGKKKSRSLLKKVFSAWSNCTLKERCGRIETDLALLQSHKMQGEEKLVVDFTKMSEAVEAMKVEKNQIQDQYRRLQDDLVDARATVDKLQQRLEQQKNTVTSWRECALQLTSAIRLPPRSLEVLFPSQVLVPATTSTVAVNAENSPVHSPVSRSLVSYAYSPITLTGDCDADVLQWVNLVRGTAHHSSDQENDPLGVPVGSVIEATNFGVDLSSGEVLLDIVKYLDLPGSHSKELSAFSQPQMIAYCLTRLQEYSSCSSLTISVDEVLGATKPELLRAILSLVMRRASLCPLCSPDGITALSTARVEAFADFRTPYEVNNAFAKSIENYRLITRAQTQSTGTAVAAAVTAAAHAGSARPFVDRQLVADLFAHQGLPALSKEELDELSQEVIKFGADIGRIFRCYAPIAYGGTVSLPRFQKFMSDTKLTDKNFSEREATLLFDVLAEKEVGRTKPATSSHQTQHRHAQCGIASWVALLVVISASRTQEGNAAATVLKRFIALVEKSRKSATACGIDEFLELVGSPQVQEVLSKNSAQISRMFDETCQGASTGMTVFELTSCLKEAKVLEYPVTTEEVRKLVEFITDQSADTARLNLDTFIQCVAAVGLVKYSMVWSPISERIKTFLKKDLLTSSTSRGVKKAKA